MTFERDPIIILHNEILKTQELKKKFAKNKNYQVRKKSEDYLYENSDQDFINDYVNMSGFTIDDY